MSVSSPILMTTTPRRWVLLAIVVLLPLVLAVLAPNQARASEADSVCSLIQGVELDDGSVVAAGEKCLVKLNAQGKLDSSFGEDGSVPLNLRPADGTGGNGTGGEVLMRLIALPDGFLVVSYNSLYKFTGTGLPDTGFGGDGKVVTENLSPSIETVVDAVAGSDGSIYVPGFAGWRPEHFGEAVAKIKPSGELDQTFGVDGVFHAVDGSGIDFNFKKIVLDQSGGVLVTGGKYGQAVRVVRLGADGAIDAGFGANGIASADIANVYPNGSGVVSISSISIGTAGDVIVTGGVTYYWLVAGSTDPFGASFDESGNLISASTVDVQWNGPAALSLPGGDLVLDGSGGQRIHPDGTEAFPADPTFDPSKVSPGWFETSDLTYNPSTGNLLSVVGLFGDGDCAYACPERREAVVKINADSGDAITDFGPNGTAMPDPNRCDAGLATPVPGYGPWRRCLLPIPASKLQSSISRSRSSRARFHARLAVPAPPTYPLYSSRKILIRLPARLPLKKNALKKRLTVSPEADADGRFVVKRRGRLISVYFKPERIVWFPEYDPPPSAATIEVVVAFKRGSIKRLPRNRKFRLKARVVQVAAPESAPWWGSNSRTFTTKVKLKRG
ncbi:MAG: hypothetical protein WBW44_00630 [Solirubrobacterales bacterium]